MIAMMPARRPSVTYAEYIAAEERAETKHWFFDGEVYAMSGGTPEHSALAAAVMYQLQGGLEGRPCRVFTSDLRVRVAATGMATYPDVSVVCGKLETDPEDSCAITNPILLVEVLSDSTEAHDRGEKAAHYRRIKSLREYVLVSQRAPRIEVYRRNEAQRWELFESGAGESAELLSVRCSLDVSRVYRDPLAVS
jgi:Uma2 family endonuclease